VCVCVCVCVCAVCVCICVCICVCACRILCVFVCIVWFDGESGRGRGFVVNSFVVASAMIGAMTL
jgi:hypothetical protein